VTKAVLEPVFIDEDAPSPFETYSNGLDAAKMLDTLNLELNHKKTFHARDWRRKYEKKFGKQEV
jgi:hypothetical protein